MKTCSQYIDEAYSFRLGGSQNKGFGQTEIKSFGELTEGDSILYMNSGPNLIKKPVKLRINNVETNNDNIKFQCNYSDDYDVIVRIPHSHEDTKFYDAPVGYGRNDFIVSGTDEDFFIDNLNYYHHLNFKVDDIEDRTNVNVDEAYNFRLGGSQKKGFNQNYKKKLSELEDGDFIYIVNIDTSLELDDDLQACQVSIYNNAWTGDSGWETTIKESDIENKEKGMIFDDYITQDLDDAIEMFKTARGREAETIMVMDSTCKEIGEFYEMNIDEFKKKIEVI